MRGQKDCGTEVRESHHETVSSEHERTPTLKNSGSNSVCRRSNQWLSNKEQGGACEPPTTSWGAVDSWWCLGERESIFFKSVAPDRLAMFQQMGTHSRVYRQHKLNVVVLVLNRKKVGHKIGSGWEHVGLYLRGNRGRIAVWTKLHCMHVWNSQKLMKLCYFKKVGLKQRNKNFQLWRLWLTYGPRAIVFRLFHKLLS